MLPYVDEHGVTIAAPRNVVWTVLRHHVDSLCGTERHSLARLLGTEPASGFQLTEEVPNQHLSLAGQQRFSRYRLAFDVADLPDGATRLTATTYATFPGPHGRIYRALVIGTRGHVVAVAHMLRTIRRLSTDRP
jgi:hypothetical protein